MLRSDSLPLFDGTSEDFRREIDKVLRWKNVNAGQEIINREDCNTDLILVQKGRVRVAVYTLSGREVMLDDVEAGGFFGELAAIDKAPRSATVFAVEPSTIAFLSAQKFEECLRHEASVGFKIMQRMAEIIRQSSIRIVELSTLGANNRIHAEILRLGRERGVEKDGKIYITPVPVHTEIAGRVSTARETVARAMNDLARKNIVTREKRTLIIHDMKKLADMVQDVRGDEG